MADADAKVEGLDSDESVVEPEEPDAKEDFGLDPEDEAVLEVEDVDESDAVGTIRLVSCCWDNMLVDGNRRTDSLARCFAGVFVRA